MAGQRDPFIWGVGIEGSAIPHLGISQYGWTGHDRRWARDLRTIRDALGACWLRYPVSWERLQPKRGVFEWGEVEERLTFAHELGFRVAPGLVHFGTPAWLPGAFGDPEFPETVEQYARSFAERFDRLAGAYVPVNEPLITALFAGDLGFWPPFGKGWRGYMPVLSRIAQGLARATAAIRGVNPEADILYVEGVEDHRSCDPALATEIERRNQRRFLLLDLVAGEVDEDHPLHGWLVENGFPEYDLAWLRGNPQRPSRLGLDYYAHSESEVWQAGGRVKQRPPHVRRGFAALAREYHERYGWPIVLTETNAAGAQETKSAWLDEMVREVAAARGVGVLVEGFFWWPAFDHVDWDGALLHRSGNRHPVGLWSLAGSGEVSYELVETPLVRAFAELARGGETTVGPLARPVRPALARHETLSAGNETALGAGRSAASPRAEGFPIVVHSHLRWSFVWQRPQQTQSRLARAHPVLFLEEPLWIGEGEPVRLQLTDPWTNVTVAQPMLPFGLRERREEIDEAVLALLGEALDGPLGRRFSHAVHWLYTPQMETQLAAFPEAAAVVYDCMDELTRFAYAPPELARRERRLLQRADLVFTGGHELYLSKRQRHSNVHFFGCGVDFEHFNRAARGGAVPPDLAFIPSPRLGYVGVVDERLDYDLLGSLARENPDWSLVLIGPVVKVDPAALPRPANAFYLGARGYETLPSYLAGFDVCLMPFALNAATRFINPTKTLEYLATGLPVVSTPVRDVVHNFGDVVHIAARGDFSACVRRVLAGERFDAERGLATARATSWDGVVGEMERLVEEALSSRGQPLSRRLAGANDRALGFSA